MEPDPMSNTRLVERIETSVLTSTPQPQGGIEGKTKMDLKTHGASIMKVIMTIIYKILSV
jgi:hypothetical protein